jgi:hypothetical protein
MPVDPAHPAVNDPSGTPETAFDALEAHPRWRRLGWLYLVCGLVWCCLSVGSMSMNQAGGAPVLVACLVSLNILLGVYRHLFRQPLVTLLLVWTAWMLITVLWTPSPAEAGHELGRLRYALSIFTLYPLLMYRRYLIAALAVGFLLTNLSQLVLWGSHHFDIDWLQFREWRARNSGWWSLPPHAYMFAGALGLHLPAALMGSGRMRWLGVAGCVVTWVGMLATGTRGAWLAGAGLMVVGVAVAVLTDPRRAWRSLRWALAAAVLAGTAGWVLLGDHIAQRAKEGVAEIRGAMEEKEYETDTGARFKFARWGLEAFAERPITGIGAGGYRAWTHRKLMDKGIHPASVRTAGQAHNLWAHAAGTLGIVGFGLALAISWVAIRGGFDGVSRQRLGTYDAGPAFALIGMLLTTPFDVPYVNSPQSALLGVLLALCLFDRPRERTPVWPWGREHRVHRGDTEGHRVKTC